MGCLSVRPDRLWPMGVCPSGDVPFPSSSVSDPVSCSRPGDLSLDERTDAGLTALSELPCAPAAGSALDGQTAPWTWRAGSLSVSVPPSDSAGTLVSDESTALRGKRRLSPSTPEELLRGLPATARPLTWNAGGAGAQVTGSPTESLGGAGALTRGFSGFA